MPFPVESPHPNLVLSGSGIRSGPTKWAPTRSLNNSAIENSRQESNWTVSTAGAVMCHVSSPFHQSHSQKWIAVTAWNGGDGEWEGLLTLQCLKYLLCCPLWLYN